MKRAARPITPAPIARTRYPRVGAVWGAFAAGTLGGAAGLTGGVARADCALPAHEGAADAQRGKRAAALPKGNESAIAKKSSAPRVEKKAKVRVAIEPIMHTGGVAVSVHPPKLPDYLPPVPPRHERPAQAQPPAVPPQPPPEPDESQIGPGPPEHTVLIHPHRPDEPCQHGEAGSFLVRYT